MLIDIHAHAYRAKAPHIRFCTLPELLCEQDRLGIDKSVVLPIVSPEIYFPQANEDILDMAAAYPERIIPFCNIDPRTGWNSPFTPFEKYLAYYKEKGCRGIGEVMPNLRTDDLKVQNLFRAAEAVGLPLTIDGSDQLDGDFGLYDEAGLPQLELSLRRFPGLVIFGHGPIFWGEIARLETPGEKGAPYRFAGGQFGRLPNHGQPIREEGVVAKLLRRYPNLHCDLSDCTAYNALTRDLAYTEAFIGEFADRMYFGTDIVCPGMPVPLIDTLAEWKRSGLITEDAYRKITHENAMSLLGL